MKTIIDLHQNVYTNSIIFYKAKHIGQLACVLIMFMMLTGCGKFSYEEDIATMTQEDKIEDFEYVIDTMDALYPYWGELSEVGIDKEALQKEYKDKIMQSQDTVEYIKVVTQYFKELSNKCGHLSYLAPPAYYRYRDIYKELKPWNRVLTNNKSRAMYGAMNPSVGVFELATEKEITKEDAVTTQNQEDELTMEILQDGTVIYIRCPSFEWHRAKSEPEKIIEFITKHSDCENLIIDIRGNGGGSDNYWYDAFVIPNITQNVTYSMYYLYTNETLQNKEARKYIKGKRLPDNNNTIEELPSFEKLSPYASNFNYFCPLTNTIESKNKEVLFQGDMYVLMDGHNSSASATFTGFCKENKFAVLVGEATGGNECFGDPALFAMPKSGLIFRFDLFYGLNADGTCNGVSGVKPDIECDPKNALEVCLEEIKK